MIKSLESIFSRDLAKLSKEIELYKDENIIWHYEKNIANSAGNLCLHLVGNLNTYIGAEIGKTGYVRNRESEFTSKGVERSVLIQMVSETNKTVKESFLNFNTDLLQTEYPLLVFDTKTSYEFFLIHLATHLNYHLGQINYHRRLLDV